MRFLFTFTGGTGHFIPTAPFARALAARGHTIKYACQESMVSVVRSEGWDAVASGGSTLLKPDQRRPLAPLNRAAERDVVRRFFAGEVARERAGRLLDVVRDYRPDVIVRDELDFGAAVAAEACRVPHAAVIVIAAGGFLEPTVLAEPLALLRAEYGLADDGLAMLHRHLTLVPVPPSFRDPLDPVPSTARYVRPAVLNGDQSSDWRPHATAGPPRVYFTLGTIFHQESGDLFQRVLSGLSSLPAEIVVSVGNEIDPAELGPQPPNVHVERFVDAGSTLSRCDLVVSHAGSGTVVGALAFGLPQVLLPLGADQPLNADRCIALGVAVVLNASTANGQEIRHAVRTVLEDRSFQINALRVRDEIRSLPGTAQAAELLEMLAVPRS